MRAARELRNAAGPASPAQPVLATWPLPPPRRGVDAGVRVGWLRQFAQEQCAGLTTADVVEKIVKPATSDLQCRYVALLEAGSAVGRATIFVSHTWRASFCDLVAAVCHVLPEDSFVWVDIFAVLQWPGPEQAQDLDFAAVVGATDALLLVSVHLPEVLALSRLEAELGGASIPEAAPLGCAFFRVWCIVELVTALRLHKPVIMLVGSSAADGSLRFEPNRSMLGNLSLLVDVASASASVDEDRVRILAEVQEAPGVAAVNTLARGAIGGADICMGEREVLAAAAGHAAPLRGLEGQERLGRALVAAAAGGFLAPLTALLARPDAATFIDFQLYGVSSGLGHTALMRACYGGHAAAVEALVRAGAQVNRSNGSGGSTARALARHNVQDPAVLARIEELLGPDAIGGSLGQGGRFDAEDDDPDAFSVAELQLPSRRGRG